MTKKLQRFLTALMTLLFIAPSFTASAIDAPSDLKIKGWTVNDNEWGDIGNSASKVTDDGTVFYFDVKMTSGRLFKVQVPGGSEWGASGGDTYIDPDKTYGMTNIPTGDYVSAYGTEKEGDTHIAVAFYKNAASPLVRYSYTDERPVIEVPQEQKPTVPEKLYLIGHHTGTSANNWGWDDGMEGEKDGNVFRFNDVYLLGYDYNGSRTDHSYFAFSQSNAQTVSGNVVPYYGPAADTDISMNTLYTFGGLVKSGAWNITNGNYDIVVNFEDPAHPTFILTEHIPTLEVPSDLYFIYKDNVQNNDWSGAGSVRYSSKSADGNVFIFDKIDVNGADFIFSPTSTKGERYFGTPTGAEHVYAKIKQPVPFSDEKSGYWHLSTGYKYRIEVDFTDLHSPVYIVYRINDSGDVYPDVPAELYLIGYGTMPNENNVDETFTWDRGVKGVWNEADKTFTFNNVNFTGQNNNVNSQFAFSSTQDRKDIYYTNPWCIRNRPVTYDVPMDMGIGQAGYWFIQTTGLRNIVVSFKDPENPTVTITRLRSNETMPTDLYMIGNISGTNGWSDSSNSNHYDSQIEGLDASGKKVVIGYEFKAVTFNGENGRSTFAFTTQRNGKGEQFFGSNDLNEIDEDADEGRVNKMRLVSNAHGKGWIVENGTYDFDVYFNDPTDPYFVFYVTEPSQENVLPYTGPGKVPDHLFLIGAVGDDSNNWDIARSYVEPTRVDNEAGKIYFDNVYIHGNIGFSTDADHANHTPTACMSTDNFWGAMNPSSTASTGNVNYLYGRAIGKDTSKGNPYALQNGTGRYNIIVTFRGEVNGKPARPYFTYEYIPSYYFIGDINDWFSVEFEGGVQGINADRFKDRYNWQFEPVFIYLDSEGNVLPEEKAAEAASAVKTEWYKFDKFPGKLLSGQFKIVTDGGWDGNTPYCHKQVVDPGAISGSGVTQQSLFEAYISRPITKKMIQAANFHDYYVNENDNVLTDDEIQTGTNNLTYGVYTDLVRQGRSSVPTGNGGNLHLECNAVKDAVVYFKPSETDPKIILDGEPIDYFIFYGMDSDGTAEDLVTTKMQNDKPNSNNYYMPGINGLLPVGNESHMAHAQGIDLVKIDLTQNSDDIAQALSMVISPDCDENRRIISDIADKRLLPNMYDLQNLTEIYITKVPSGYENPAGEKYMFNFINALESETKQSSHALTTSHKYYFPTRGGAHVHAYVNDRNNYGGEANTPVYEIAYRVYYVHSDYNTYVIGTEHKWPNVNTTELGTNLGRSAQLKKPWEYDDPNHPVVTAGWVILDNKVHNDDLREMGARVPAGFSNEYWMIAHKDDHQPAQAAAAGPRKATNEANENDIRQVVRQRFANAGYVQYRITSKSKDGNTVYNTVFYPEIPDQQEHDSQYFPMNSQDVFAAFDNDNGLLTVIREIEDEGIVESDEAQGEVIWYTLQGQRVSNPAGGIFIKVQGKTSKKVILR